ncbi:MAG: Rrf2 family transcriptional regulator [Deltaproteobacteria bacterium]|nr:Rrf2 family transcriptional regulator [Deltaproteobacteria bacterium]
MFLPQTAEYGLRAMAQMASRGAGVSVRTKDLAEQTQIPAHYLSKIMRRLVAAGVLESEKGHGGGFRFARPLHRIRFADVLEACGFEIEPNRCAFGLGQCNLKNPCLLHPSFSELNGAIRQWAAKTTLQDVADGTTPIRFVPGA